MCYSCALRVVETHKRHFLFLDGSLQKVVMTDSPHNANFAMIASGIRKASKVTLDTTSVWQYRKGRNFNGKDVSLLI